MPYTPKEALDVEVGANILLRARLDGAISHRVEKLQEKSGWQSHSELRRINSELARLVRLIDGAETDTDGDRLLAICLDSFQEGLDDADVMQGRSR